MTVKNDFFGTGTDFTNTKPIPVADFNDTIDYLYANVGKCVGILGTQDGRNQNAYNHLFTADDAATKTNFTYESTFNEYFCLGTSAGVLETATDNATYNFNGTPFISKAFLRWQYHVFTVYDECSDSSFDTALWDTDATVTEDTASFTWDTTSDTEYVRTDASNGDFIDSDDILIIWIVQSGNASGDTQKIILTDASNDVDIYTWTNATKNLRLTIKFVDSEDKAYVWEGGTGAGSYVGVFDISSLTKWQLEIQTVESIAGTVTTDVYYLRRITGSETTTVTESFSSDSGSNYSTASNGFVRIPTAQARAVMQAKLTSTPAAGEGVIVKRVDYQGFSEND